MTVLAMAGVSQPALAECSIDICSNVRITGIYAYGAYGPGHAWIETSGTESLLTTCNPGSDIFLRVDGGEAKSDWLFAQIMTAFQTDQVLRVRVTGGGGVCRVTDIWARK